MIAVFQYGFVGFTWILTEFLIVVGGLFASIGGGCSLASWCEAKMPRIFSAISDVASMAWMMGWITFGYWMVLHSSRYFLAAMQ